MLLASAGMRGREFRLFGPSTRTARRDESFFLAGAPGGSAALDSSAPWFDAWPDAASGAAGKTSDAPADRVCVLFQCIDPAVDPPPPSRIFTPEVTVWTSTALLLGFGVAIDGPASSGFHHMKFTDEGFFQTWTYGGGADKVSHFVISANIASLLDDAYRLNQLSADQSFALSIASTIAAGLLVEIGDGVTPYGFSAQDLTADTLGALSGALVKRNHLDDTIGFRLGLVPTTIPDSARQGSEFSGIKYHHEIYTADLKFAGLSERLRWRPGVGRYLVLSFAFLTKGYGYEPMLPSRYQEVGVEVGLNVPEILRAVGVRSTSWWGDLLLRTFEFLRLPFTQIGVYYNLGTQRWYGPNAPNRYY